PSADELHDAATGSTALRRLTAFVTWVGEGRTLDPAGALTPDDAQDAATAVGMDGGQPEFVLLVRWARAAGLVRTLKGELVPVRSRGRLIGRPVDLWERVFLAFAGVGERHAEDEPRFVAPMWHHWREMFELVTLSLYTAGGSPVPAALLLEITFDAPVGMLGFAPYSNPPRAVRQQWRGHLRDALTALESLGAITTEVSDDPDVRRMIREATGQKKPDPTLVALTPIGLWALNRWLVEQGVRAPVVGELAGAPLVELIDALSSADPEIVDAELAGWVAHRGAEQAAVEAQTVLETAEEPARRLRALPVLSLVGEHGPRTAQQLRAAGGIPGSLATMWLLADGSIEPSQVALRETMLGFVDQLSVLADDGIVDEAFQGHPVADQLAMIAECSRTGHPDLVDVLDAIVDAPVDRKVAKAARKARLRLRT
ncbi:MAG: hypothetical protein L0H64_20995, partial [Pseudonocardia sp.]|nr:hypothetical protein [Pseudonocardia sp.]